MWPKKLGTTQGKTENSCQKNNNSLRTRRDLGKTTVLPESTLNFAYIHIKKQFFEKFEFFAEI